MPLSSSSIGAFLARTFGFFVLVLALWYLAREWVVAPPAWVAELAMRALFSDWVRGTERAGDVQTLVTTLSVAAADGRIGDLAVDAELFKYCCGAPLLAALLLASRPRGWAWKLPLGLLVLVPLQAFSICADWLLHVAVLSGPVPAHQAGFGAVAVNLIGAAYQLGFLILPTLAPVLVWLMLDRKMIATVLLDGALAGYRPRSG